MHKQTTSKPSDRTQRASCEVNRLMCSDATSPAHVVALFGSHAKSYHEKLLSIPRIIVPGVSQLPKYELLARNLVGLAMGRSRRGNWQIPMHLGRHTGSRIQVAQPYFESLTRKKFLRQCGGDPPADLIQSAVWARLFVYEMLGIKSPHGSHQARRSWGVLLPLSEWQCKWSFMQYHCMKAPHTCYMIGD